MANAKQAGMPGWVKAMLGGLALLVVGTVVLMAIEHNPLVHIFGHAGMAG